MALLAGNHAGTVVGFAIGITGLYGGLLRLAILHWLLRFRRAPRRELPHNAGEALQLQLLFLPLATWGAGAVQGSQTSIDGSRIGSGTESMTWRG